jgi:hypothetical protein
MQLQQQQFNNQKKTESQIKDGGKTEHSEKNLTKYFNLDTLYAVSYFFWS